MTKETAFSLPPELEPREKLRQVALEFGLCVFKYTFATDENAEQKFAALVVQPQESDRLPKATVHSYVEEYPEVKQQSISNDCFEIVKYSFEYHKEGRLLRTLEGASDFIGWGNHSIIQYEAPDGSLLACDLTATGVIEGADILVLRATDQENMVSYLDALYGGEWWLY